MHRLEARSDLNAVDPALNRAAESPESELVSAREGDDSTAMVKKPVGPPSPFPRIKGYRLLKLLGQGGMGKVYVARQESLDREVAIKVLCSPISDFFSFAERFRREAHAIARLKHPNIVAIHDFGQTVDGAPYYAMELVEGANLANLIRSGTGVTIPTALEITRQVCDALDYAHNRGIVHRDIKPANILVDRYGNAKVADFGLVRIVDADDQSHSRTLSGLVMGTPNYMAPEQALNSATADHRADIFSVGVIFYEMLTGELPLGSFKRPSIRIPGLDVLIDHITEHALEPHREDRYQSASQVRTDVERVQERMPRTSSRHGAFPLPGTRLGRIRSLLKLTTKPRVRAYAMCLGGAAAISLPVWSMMAPGKGVSPIPNSKPPFRVSVSTGSAPTPKAQLSINGQSLSSWGGSLPGTTQFPVAVKIHAPGFEDIDREIVAEPADRTLHLNMPSLVRSTGKVHVKIPAGGVDYSLLELKWLTPLEGEESAPAPPENPKIALDSSASNALSAEVATGRYQILLTGSEPRMLDQALGDAVEVRAGQTAEIPELPPSVSGTYEWEIQFALDGGKGTVRVKREITLQRGLTGGVCTQKPVTGTLARLAIPLEQGPFQVKNLQFDPEFGIRGALTFGKGEGEDRSEPFTIKDGVVTFDRPLAFPGAEIMKGTVSSVSPYRPQPPCPVPTQTGMPVNGAKISPMDIFDLGPRVPKRTVQEPAKGWQGQGKSLKL